MKRLSVNISFYGCSSSEVCSLEPISYDAVVMPKDVGKIHLQRLIVQALQADCLYHSLEKLENNLHFLTVLSDKHYC